MIGKTYILDGIEKDITDEKAIGLLIDNAIEASEYGMMKLENVEINITISKEHVVVEDNCIGVEKDKWSDLFIIESRSYQNCNGSGLKKAIFKIGEEVRITTHNERFSAMSKKVRIEDIIENNGVYLEPTIIEEGKTGFKIEIKKLKKTFWKRNRETKIRKYIARRYRAFIQKGIGITLNGEKIRKSESELSGNLIKSFNTVIDDQKVKLVIFNGVVKEESEVSILANDKVIDEQVSIKEFKNISKKGKTYINFHGEIEIVTDDLERIGVWPTRDGIKEETEFMAKLITFFKMKIEETREYFDKGSITVQFNISNEVYNQAQNLLLREGVDTDIAKEVGERIFYYGLTMKQEKNDYKWRMRQNLWE